VKNQKGLLVIISSPSGGGKTTVIKKLLKDYSSDKLVYSISMTTRPKRPGEINGIDYWFVDEKTFLQNIENGNLLEHEQVHNHYYGTPKAPIENWLKEKKAILLDIDVKGAGSIKAKFRDDCVSIFLKPPDLSVLIERLKKRSTESEKELETRLSRVKTEIESANQFDYIVVNDELHRTVKKIQEIIFKHI